MKTPAVESHNISREHVLFWMLLVLVSQLPKLHMLYGTDCNSIVNSVLLVDLCSSCLVIITTPFIGDQTPGLAQCSM